MVTFEVPSSPSSTSSRRSSRQRSWTPSESPPTPRSPPELPSPTTPTRKRWSWSPSEIPPTPHLSGWYPDSPRADPTLRRSPRRSGAPSPPSQARATRRRPGDHFPTSPPRRGTWPPNPLLTRGVRRAGSRNEGGRHVVIYRGKLGRYQGDHSQATCVEEPHKEADWNALRRDVQGVEYFRNHLSGIPKRLRGGEAWFMPNVDRLGGSGATDKLACREVIDYRQPGEPSLDGQIVDDIRTLLDHPNLVQLLDHDGFATETLRNETAWEHCDAGSLNHLLIEEKKQSGIDQYLPESLIWHTLISLLKAVSYLSTGWKDFSSSDNDSRPPKEDWKPIIHNLINPTNIFYCHPKSRRGHKVPTYGPCKLANFTDCTVLDPNNIAVDLSSTYQRRLQEDTTGYEAPERLLEPVEFAGASDVWSIGAVAVAMMTNACIWVTVLRQNITTNLPSGRYSPGGSILDWRSFEPEVRFHRLMVMCKIIRGRMQMVEALPTTYSPGLRVFVAQLVAPFPHNRADVEELLRKAIRSRDEVRSSALRRGERDEYVGEDEIGSGGE